MEEQARRLTSDSLRTRDAELSKRLASLGRLRGKSETSEMLFFSSLCARIVSRCSATLRALRKARLPSATESLQKRKKDEEGLADIYNITYTLSLVNDMDRILCLCLISLCPAHVWVLAASSPLLYGRAARRSPQTFLGSAQAGTGFQSRLLNRSLWPLSCAKPGFHTQRYSSRRSGTRKMSLSAFAVVSCSASRPMRVNRRGISTIGEPLNRRSRGD